MLSSLIPNHDAEMAWLGTYGTAGYVVAFNMTLRGPEHLHTTYPQEWVDLYQKRNYFFRDPVNIWTFLHSGDKRWSEIVVPDTRDVMREAARFGLVHGAIFSRIRGFRKSFMSVARADRELTDAEIAALSAKFDSWTDMVIGAPALTSGEIEVLRGLKDGLERAELAERLGISESGVKQRLSKACGKLRARTATQAVAIAVARNYLLD
jgi:LuxR family transcriptional regulator, quorum-sensing system regulator SdiA